MKKFSSSASLSNNNNCNSNSSKSNNSAKITSKLIANQITNDIIKPKAISAAEAKLKNTNKNYAKITSASDSNANTNTNKSNGGGYKIYNRQECDSSDYLMRLNQPSTSIDVLSCVSTNSSSDSSSTLNVCEYFPTESANCRKKSIVNDYATADYVMHRPKSSQSQHNPYKLPAEKKQHRKHYAAQGLRSPHTPSSSQIYAKKQHHHTKKSSAHHHNHTHKQTAAQYTTPHSLHMSASPPSPPPLRLPSTAKKDRHS